MQHIVLQYFFLDNFGENIMSAKGVAMRKIKTVLRLHYENKLSQHQIAKSIGLSVGVVNKYINLAQQAKLTWPLEEELTNEIALKKFLLPIQQNISPAIDGLNFPEIHKELKLKGVTLQLLWEEYSQELKNPYSYSNFCLMYRKWRNTQPKSMRQTHKAGDKAFVDYAGQTFDIIDSKTGEIRAAQIFVGILGASNFTYAEATWTQKIPDWVASHKRMFEFFGGVPALIVPDNLKSGICKFCRYDPEINPTYADFIDYYGTAVLPARPSKPKDKPKVENAVLVVERWILARLRKQTFFGLDELNAAIKKLLHELNNRPFKKLPGCRASLFAETDQPVLKPLPKYNYEICEIKFARVQVDYHIELDFHYYSVPYQYVGKKITVCFTTTRVECSYQGKKLAIHVRSYEKGKHTTIPEHMPKSHRKYLECNAETLLQWAKNVGISTTKFITSILESKLHPEQGYRSCLGIINLAKRYGKQRLENACQYAWQQGVRTRKSLASILAHNMDLQLQKQDTYNNKSIIHDNLRGKNYHH